MRRRALFTCLLPATAAAFALVACADPEPTPEQRLDRGLSRAFAWLASRQDADGRWHSLQYGALRDDLSLTGTGAKAMAYGQEGLRVAEVERALSSVRTALDAIRRDPLGNPAPGAAAISRYPVYTLALAALTLTKIPGDDAVALRERVLTELRAHQLADPLGWTPADAAYGGWGYSLAPLRRPADGSPPLPFDADLSSTVFAVGALRVAGVPAEDVAIRRALVFVKRCQNLPLDDGADLDPRFDDGGFHFTPTNDAQNKAGLAGTDASGRNRWRSYGSATADGLRALVRCGLPASHPRVAAALRWLSEHWSATENPGAFPEVREVERRSSYFYWCWSASHAFRLLGISVLERGGTRIFWARDLSAALLKRQRDDGSFANAYGQLMEDDPLVATPFAVGALSLCRLLW